MCNSYQVSLAYLVDYNGNDIEIKISITKNKRCCNVILIIIHLFDDNTIMKLWRVKTMEWKHFISNLKDIFNLGNILLI